MNRLFKKLSLIFSLLLTCSLAAPCFAGNEALSPLDLRMYLKYANTQAQVSFKDVDGKEHVVKICPDCKVEIRRYDGDEDLFVDFKIVGGKLSYDFQDTTDARAAISIVKKGGGYATTDGVKYQGIIASPDQDLVIAAELDPFYKVRYLFPNQWGGTDEGSMNSNHSWVLDSDKTLTTIEMVPSTVQGPGEISSQSFFTFKMAGSQNEGSVIRFREAGKDANTELLLNANQRFLIAGTSPEGTPKIPFRMVASHEAQDGKVQLNLYVADAWQYNQDGHKFADLHTWKSLKIFRITPNGPVKDKEFNLSPTAQISLISGAGSKIQYYPEGNGGEIKTLAPGDSKTFGLLGDVFRLQPTGEAGGPKLQLGTGGGQDPVPASMGEIAALPHCTHGCGPDGPGVPEDTDDSGDAGDPAGQDSNGGNGQKGGDFGGADVPAASSGGCSLITPENSASWAGLIGMAMLALPLLVRRKK